MAVPHAEAASLQLLLDSFVAIASERSVETVLEQAVDLARLCTRARYGAAVALADGEIALFVHHGLSRAQVAALPHEPRGLGMLAAVLVDKVAIRRDVLQADARSVGFPLNHVPMGAFLGVPVIHDDEVLGGLYLTKSPGQGFFSEEDELFVQALARQSAVAMEAARLLAEKDRLNDELRAADQLKTDFVSMASHELRTPLTSIRAAATMIRAYWDATTDERKLDLLGVVENQAQRLSHLVENILAAANLEAGAVRPRVAAFDVVGLSEAVAHDFSAEAAVAVEAPGRPTASADPDHVRQILVNYVGNALKYGATPIGIRVSERPDGVELRVLDAGEGVPEAFVPQLFDKFTQASSGDTRRSSGSGLGLSIVRGLAEASGGTVWYEARHPCGSCFGLSLPKAD